MPPKDALEVLVRSVTYQTETARSYELVDADLQRLPEFTAGSHIDVFFRDGRIRQYSLANDPAEKHRYVIGVLREDKGRGGSRLFHDRVVPGYHIFISAPRNNFHLSSSASRHILVGGGIGITPLLSMAWELKRTGSDFVLHYCTRSPQETAFQLEMAPLVRDGKAIIHHDGGNPAKGLDIAELLADRDEGDHVYYCGPPGFMAAVRESTSHWPAGTVHFEYFSAAIPSRGAGVSEDKSESESESHESPEVGGEFLIRIASSGKEFWVPQDRSIAEVLRENGVNVETSCESGLCATCRIPYLEGEVEHQDLVLDEEERKSELTACCSRSRSKVLVLGL